MMQMLTVAWLRWAGGRLRERIDVLGDDGQALVEYALILGLVVTLAVGTLELLGPSVAALLSEAEAAFP